MDLDVHGICTSGAHTHTDTHTDIYIYIYTHTRQEQSLPYPAIPCARFCLLQMIFPLAGAMFIQTPKQKQFIHDEY